MIFYFSATGNSKYAAGRIASSTEDRLISLKDTVRGRSYRYDVSREERIGFVNPLPAAAWTADNQGFGQFTADSGQHAFLLSGFQIVSGYLGCGGVVNVEDSDDVVGGDGDVVS